IDNFDLKHKVRFSTYAVPMIIGEIRRYLRDNNPIRVSRSLRDTAYKALKVREELIQKTSREPTSMEIAKEMEIEHADIVLALDAIQDPVSLFEPIYEDGGDPIYVMDQVSDDSDDEHSWDDFLSLKEGMIQLNGREKNILNKRFFQGKTQMERSEERRVGKESKRRMEAEDGIRDRNVTGVQTCALPISLFEPIYEDGGDPIYVMDQVSDDSDDEHSWDDFLSLKEGMIQLNGREKNILNKRFFQGKTQME